MLEFFLGSEESGETIGSTMTCVFFLASLSLREKYPNMFFDF